MLDGASDETGAPRYEDHCFHEQRISDRANVKIILVRGTLRTGRGPCLTLKVGFIICVYVTIGRFDSSDAYLLGSSRARKKREHWDMVTPAGVIHRPRYAVHYDTAEMTTKLCYHEDDARNHMRSCTGILHLKYRGYGQVLVRLAGTRAGEGNYRGRAILEPDSDKRGLVDVCSPRQLFVSRGCP